MSRVAQRFALLREKGEKALITYVVAGDPDLETSRSLLHALAEAGVDMVELGLPFSDPLADGPTIQAGSQRALAAGANTDTVLAMLRQAREEGIDLPVLLMTYYNLLVRPGVENFCARAREAGADGLIVPDVPMEEADELLAATRAVGLDLVQLVAPTSTDDRVRRAAELASGFIYCVSLTGVTGARSSLPPQLSEFVGRVKGCTDKPVAVGFGVSTPEQVREVAAVADGVIVGSAIVGLCGEGLPRDELVRRVRTFAAQLKEATRLPQRAEARKDA
ncbi:MAG TPA: tryptophan synthase subunit alpha [Symbiobacteriaceae bacterium]